VLQHREVRVVIVGSGPEEPALRALAAELGVAERVHWTGFQEDVSRVLGACDVFVLSSRNEGMANVMLEAMAARVPVVAAEISGVQDALGAVRGRPAAGWIVRAEDAPALAAGLDEVLRGLGASPEAVR
jgi:glycosyltransferase involved in cell wall biosynthesis